MGRAVGRGIQTLAVGPWPRPRPRVYPRCHTRRRHLARSTPCSRCPTAGPAAHLVIGERPNGVAARSRHGRVGGAMRDAATPPFLLLAGCPLATSAEVSPGAGCGRVPADARNNGHFPKTGRRLDSEPAGSCIAAYLRKDCEMNEFGLVRYRNMLQLVRIMFLLLLMKLSNTGNTWYVLPYDIAVSKQPKV